ncbi:DUF6242 domain-containing protein [Xylanibacter ruminicola]|uniref:BNR/Asp-box repeat protein n=1 Tax=Xylanibacter ruminicola TaxID=839 RepID=A0A1M6TI46_XYLRU|nr:DUF6242 domain-containing protein [Xylanibacter ruminicola]SHK56584.1 hypothetical protein SAMN05216463_10624 [Xylanibacter ruminicola]
MKRYISTLCTMLVCVLLVTSCLKDEDTNTQYYNDTAIASFKLATVNRYLHTTSSTGTDSVYKVTLSDPVVFTIDQQQCKIYNTDSLPSDVDLNHILATITSKYSGTVVINYPATDGLDSLLYYSSSDSIDFEKLKDLRVYAQDGSGYRSYEVKVNVHKAQTNKMIWEQKTAADLPTDSKKAMWEQIAATAGMKQFIGYGTVESYAYSNDGKLMVTRDNGETWAADELDEDASWLPTENIAFVSWPYTTNDSTDYQLLAGSSNKSDNACMVWRKVAEYSKNSIPSKWVLIPLVDQGKYYLPKMENLNLVRFNGAVLAIGNDKTIYVSRDQGITWKTSSKYTLPEGLGTNNLSATTDDNGYLWLVGKDTGEVWRGLIIE